jgi:DNA recombination protein RmuC
VSWARSSTIVSPRRLTTSLESRALVSARKLKDLNVATGPREIEPVPAVELLASHSDDKVLPPPSANEDNAA